MAGTFPFGRVVKTIRTSHRGTLMPVAAAVLLATLGPKAGAQPVEPAAAQTCAGGSAKVLAAAPADLADICAGVIAAIGFLARHAVNSPEPVWIEVTQRIPKDAGPTAAGCFIEQSRRIFVVPYSSFKTNGTWFGVPITRATYRALAAHEAAHAVSACNFRISNPTIQAKEYLAYVAMFSVMPDDLRRQALRKTKTEGFATMDRFTPLLYSFDPMRFGAEAYLHFANAPDQAAIVQGVLGGTLLRD